MDDHSYDMLFAYLSLLKTVIGIITFLHCSGNADSTKKFKDDGKFHFSFFKINNNDNKNKVNKRASGHEAVCNRQSLETSVPEFRQLSHNPQCL